MPRKQADTTDSIIFNGIKFRRYPESENMSDRRYYRASGCYRKYGINYLHIEVWKSYNGEIPDGYHVHHKDGNTLNNSIDNLELLPTKEHLSLHQNKRLESAEYRSNLHRFIEKAREASKEWHRSEAGRAWHREHGREAAEKQKNMPKVKKTCVVCGKEFDVQPAFADKAMFCSAYCGQKARKKSGIDDETRVCPICGKSFRINKYSRTKTCGKECGIRSMLQSRREKRRIQLRG